MHGGPHNRRENLTIEHDQFVGGWGAPRGVAMIVGSSLLRTEMIGIAVRARAAQNV